MNAIKESRVLTFEMRADTLENGIRRISGRPIVYEARTNIGAFDEIIRVGALDTADMRDVVLTYNHDLSRIPIARSRRNNGNSTMQLLPDEQGLAMWADADTENNTEARALVSAIERRDIDGMSFIFTIGDEEWQDLETDHPTRIITRIDQIFEVSAVIFPAYDQTTINARNAEALENAKAALERARAEKPLERGIDLELAKAKYDYLYRR